MDDICIWMISVYLFISVSVGLLLNCIEAETSLMKYSSYFKSSGNMYISPSWSQLHTLIIARTRKHIYINTHTHTHNRTDTNIKL